MVIILMEVNKNFVEVVINLAEMVINLSEMVRRVAGRIRGIIGMMVGMATVKDRTLGTASSDSSIDGVVVVATADYTLLIYISGRVSSAGRSINTMARRSSMLGRRGCVMGWRINIILGRVSSVGRSINTMAKRCSMLGGRGRVMGRRINIMLGSVSMEGGTGSMEGGRVSMEVTNAQTLVGRVSSAVGSVRTKAIKGEYRSTPLGCIANINYSATVTVARRLKETGDSSSTPPLPLVVMLSRLTPILTSSSATVAARFSDSA